MVDTVILNISRDDFTIAPSVYPNFSQSVRPILNKNAKSGRYVKTNYILPTELKQLGLYFPRFSVIKARRSGGCAIFARVEFSAPKILFNNNFDELSDNGLTTVCEMLSERLEIMGITILPEKLASATVSTIHYGKNIPFMDYMTASQIIRDLAKCDVTVRKQHDKRDYVNGGEGLYFQTSTSGLIVYDKIQELKTTQWKKGRFEKDNQCQFCILDQIKSPLEVVRIEHRLLEHPIIRNTFNKYGLEFGDGRFCDLFSLEAARTILLGAFSPFLEAQNKLLATTSNVEKLATELKQNNPGLSPKNILIIIGVKALLGEDGLLDIRKMIGATSGQWFRLKQTIANAHISVQRQSSADRIMRELEGFRLVRLADYIKQ